jgi:ribosome-binding factor A
MEKVNRELRRQIMCIIQREIDDPAINFLSITSVRTTSDLKESRIYFSLLDEKQLKHVEGILNRMSSFIRVCLSKKVRIKILPHLKFIPDDSIKYSIDIYQKIEEIRAQDKEKDKQGIKRISDEK